MVEYGEVFDDIQVSTIDQPRQSNSTILSKLRSNFLTNTNQNTYLVFR
jgi:hypothetical protein